MRPGSALSGCGSFEGAGRCVRRNVGGGGLGRAHAVGDRVGETRTLYPGPGEGRPGMRATPAHDDYLAGCHGHEADRARSGFAG